MISKQTDIENQATVATLKKGAAIANEGNASFMNRRRFALMGFAAASAVVLQKSLGQEPTPSRLEEALPSAGPSVKPCSELPLSPAPPSPQTTEKLFPGF